MSNWKNDSKKQKNIATALEYVGMCQQAPIISAIGAGETAKVMKATARRYGIPLEVNQDLAKRLSQGVVDEEIDAELYYDVASVFKRL